MVVLVTIFVGFPEVMIAVVYDIVVFVLDAAAICAAARFSAKKYETFNTLYTERRSYIFTTQSQTRIIIKIKSISVQTQLNFIYYTELLVLTYVTSTSGSQLAFKTH